MPVAEVEPGARLLVKPGEVVPVDGVLLTAAVLDQSALTGEALPVEGEAGAPVRSGAVNAGSPLELRATTSAAESTYAGIVRMVSEAESLPSTIRAPGRPLRRRGFSSSRSRRRRGMGGGGDPLGR